MNSAQLTLDLFGDLGRAVLGTVRPLVVPGVGTVWRRSCGRLWRVASLTGQHVNLHRADLPRKWNNAHGEAMGAAVLVAHFGDEFTRHNGKQQ
jgi:hypothetical protein